MKKLYGTARSWCRTWTKIVFWVLFVTFAVKGLLHGFASLAPAHMQSSSQLLENGDRIVHDGFAGVSYLIYADTPSGATVEPVGTPEPAPKKNPGNEPQFFTIP